MTPCKECVGNLLSISGRGDTVALVCACCGRDRSGDLGAAIPVFQGSAGESGAVRFLSSSVSRWMTGSEHLEATEVAR